ncbi:hypothetical protein MSAN_01168100 [Mycena sanguinolenta]|uniref:Golgi apparatus membrane protein TVP38 n=1 Tax=Mycena sanguinolenta TaxID=230812 RepID=A0A8H6YN35_9AGAR|nr:hypothetical protein MSAN_01168100 [Mycena sanguinolenta]
MSQPPSQPTIVAMPQPAYAYNKPPSLAGEAHYSLPYYPPSNQDSGAQDRARNISRTPSPTPSELDALNGVRRPLSMRARIRLYITLAVVITVIALTEAYHKQIINALKPVTDWLHRTKAGPVIPIVVLIALSFPPGENFANGIIATLCGVVWGLGEGFGIVAAGTILGEICTFLYENPLLAHPCRDSPTSSFFRYCCGGRGKRLELTNMSYGTLAHVVREGGLRIAIVVRFSALPAHFTTAVFATCGMPFWVFLVAALVSLPKQIVLVYVGAALASNSSKSDKIQRIVIGVTIPVTILSLVYMRRRMEAAKPAVVYARRKARQAKLQNGVGVI